MISFKEYLIEVFMPPEIDLFRRKISNRATLKKYMTKYGFKRIGAGMSADVYEHTAKDYVIKVWNDDDSYKDWINFVIKNQNNPWVPKVIGRPVHIVEYWYAVRLEKLLKIDYRSKSYNDLYDYLDGLIGGTIETNDSNLKVVADWLKRHKDNLDIHSSNIMKRSNGQLVFTDPLS